MKTISVSKRQYSFGWKHSSMTIISAHLFSKGCLTISSHCVSNLKGPQRWLKASTILPQFATWYEKKYQLMDLFNRKWKIDTTIFKFISEEVLNQGNSQGCISNFVLYSRYDLKFLHFRILIFIKSHILITKTKSWRLLGWVFARWNGNMCPWVDSSIVRFSRVKEQNGIQEELGPEPERKGYVWTTHEDLSSNSWNLH